MVALDRTVLKSATATVVALLLFWALQPRDSATLRAQCDGGTQYESQTAYIQCECCQTEVLEDASCASGPDENGNLDLDLWWDMNEGDTDNYYYEGPYTLQGMASGAWQDCSCNWQDSVVFTGFYFSSGGSDETDVWASWYMSNVAAINWGDCNTVGGPCEFSGSTGPVAVLSPPVQVGYFDSTC